MMLISMNGKAQSSCTSPTGLTASTHVPEWNNIQLNWNGIVDTDEVTIQYADSYTTRIGMNAAADFIGAVRFTPTELSEHAGKYLSAVSFVPGENQTTCTFSIRVWTGGSLVDTVFDPGTLVVDQVVTAPLTLYGLNTIMLETPVLIDATQELWIGIRCNTSAGYPLGGENNTAVFNHGDLITEDGINWETLSGGDPTADIAAYNWVIIGHLQDPANLLSGYNVYRDGNLLTSASATSYLDSVDFGTYLYGITAEYASGCESDPINLTVTMAENPCFNCLDTASIGNGTNGQYYLPIGTYYNYSFTEQLYLASELGQIDGTIPCIAFQYIYSTPQDKDIVIYMGNTSKSSFSNGSDWISVSNMQQVFNGTVNFNTNDPDGWVNIPLDFAFEYDGSSNIVIAVLNNSGSYLNSSNTFNTHSASGKSIYVQQDGSAYNVHNLPSGSTYSYRNNIRFLIGEPVSCGLPAALTVSDVTTNSAVISWAYNEEHSGYELTIVPAGSTFDDETTLQLSDTAYEVFDLTPNTEYTIWLRAVCPSGTSSYNMSSFHTVCVPETELPYSMNFDNMGSGTGFIPDCWEAAIAPSSNPTYPYISTTYSHSGNGALYFYSYSPSHASIRGQGLDLTDNTESLLMSFWLYKASSGYGRMKAGYMTDPNDFGTFVEVLDLYAQDSPTSTWKEYKFPLPNSVNGQVIYPVLYCPYAPGGYSDYIYIDDIKIEVGDPECLAATDLHVSNVSYTSAYVTFTPTVEDIDHILVCTNQSTGISSEITLTPGTTDYMLTGLDTTTQYQVKLYPDCESIPDTVYAAFTTLMGSVIYCTDPDTSAQAISVGSTSTSYSIPLNNFYNYSYSQQIFTPSEIGAATVITGMSLNYAGPSASTVKNNVVVYLAHKNDSTFASTSDWVPISSAVKVYEGPLNCTAGWNDFEFTTFFTYDGLSNLVLIVDDNSGDYDGSSSYSFNVHTKNSGQYPTLSVYSDGTDYDPTNPPSGSRYVTRNDIKFYGCNQSQSTVISCREPNVMVTGYDSTQITLSWVPGGDETTWAVEYKETGSSSWISAGTVTGTTTYSVDNLTPNTHYDLRMCSLCSASDSSDWVEFSGFTVCAYVDVPYLEDFETATGNGSSHTIPCWFKGTNNTTQYPYPSSSQYASGTYSLYFYGTSSYYCYAATPKFNDDVEMDSLVVNFKLYATGSAYTIEMGIMSDPTDISTFVSLASCTPGIEGIWKNFEVKTTGYLGNGRHIAFRIPQWGASYMYLDDINVDYILPCSHPTAVVLQNVTADEATIGWTPGGEETEWEYLYGPAGTVDLDNDPSTSATTESVILSGLTDNTVYDFYVRSVCSADEISAWENFSFETECLPITELPYTQSFDSMCTHTSNSSTGLNNLSDCWTAHNDGTTYTSYPYVYYSSTYAASGNYSLRFYSYTSSSYSDQYAILPAVDNDLYPINTLQLTFDARRSSTSYPFCLIVGAMNGTDISTFQPIDTMLITTGSTSYEPQVIFLTSYTGSGDRLALMAPVAIGDIVTGASYNQGYIDNLVLSAAPSCPQPTHLSVTNVTENSVTLGWTENGSASNWVIEYGPQGFTPGNGTEVQANSNPFTVDNLTPAVTYSFYVKADCGGGEESPLTGPVSATPGSFNIPVSGTNTITTCAMVIYDDGGIDEDYSTNCNSTLIIQPSVPGNVISISGTVNVESGWDYLYVYDGAGTDGTLLGTYSGSYTITDLTSTTGPLTIKFTSDGTVVYPGFELTVTCLSNTCPPPSSIEVSNVGNTSADVSWTPAGSETSWIVEYKTADASTWTIATATTTSYQLTGLTGLTTYNVRVKADCGDETSSYKATSFTTPNCAATDACSYTLVLGDGYGDGWNNAYLTVEQNGFVLATMEAEDYDLDETQTYDTVEVVLCDNNSIDLVWHSGDYDGEASITLIGPDGAQIYTSPSMSSFTTYTFATDCSGSGPVITNPTVATNAATGIGQTAATLNATITNPSSVTISAKGFEWKTTTGGTYTQVAGTGTGNTFTADLTTLTPGTGYTFKAFITYNGTTTYGQEMTFTTQQQGQPTEPSATTADATNVTYNSATLNGSVANPDNVTITAQGFQWKVSTASTYTTVNATGATMTYNLTGLDASTGYTFRAFVTPANGTSYGQEKTFTTGSAPVEPCDVPTGLTVTDVQSESITVTWDNANVLRWNLQYGPVGGTLASATAYANTYMFTNLNPLTTYQIQVQAVCEEGNVSDWSPAVEATTTNLNSYLENNVTLYPNPAKEFVDVRIDGDLNVTGMEVYDVYGKLINTINVIDNTTHINVSGLANGMYFVRVTTEQGVVTKRFVKK